ncbi:glycerol-3-phosphate 1-O-acyltransferase PlsY [Sphingomonas sp. ID0503]|uniref:glycerol-3-phosphate 1-O-acyltransferase PlsY n=1 Tax=Sphingomonas sp. ID0503 TaxID=3399691 RepID=UPI003AFB0D7E
MTAWFPPAAALVIGYLLGSIPFGLILTRLGGAGDIRNIGSGNIGATNVLRTGRKGLAAATLILDALKGAVAVWVTALIAPDLGVVGAVGAFFGHLYPVWLRFRGGKGVATLLGLALALHWPCGLVYAVVWIGALALSRRSSVGGMSAAIVLPVSAMAMRQPALTLVFIPLAALLLWKHRANIARLLDGTEPKVGARTAEASDA